MNGVLVVDKPVGPTSHDVVARARRSLRIRRVGHTGTLDPAASGVLPLVVGSATRLAQYLTAGDKEYEATVTFGRTTDSYDALGQVTSESGLSPDRERLEATLPRFRGEFEQAPPAFSAKKLEGVRAYALARKGVIVAPRPVAVRVSSLELLSFAGHEARLRVRGSAGFYVRSLAHDLGQVVGTGAFLSALRRTRAGSFHLGQAVDFDALTMTPAEALAGRLVPLEALLPDWPEVQLTSDAARRIRHGQALGPEHLGGPAPSGPMVRLLAPDGTLLAVGETVEAGGLLHPRAVLG